jgi:hypothetical protein
VAAVLLPFAAMTWFHALGPLLRSPSPGAVDNGGSVTALLRLGERLAARPATAPTTVKLVFLAAEEERAPRATSPSSGTTAISLFVVSQATQTSGSVGRFGSA